MDPRGEESMKELDNFGEYPVEIVCKTQKFLWIMEREHFFEIPIPIKPKTCAFAQVFG